MNLSDVQDVLEYVKIVFIMALVSTIIIVFTLIMITIIWFNIKSLRRDVAVLQIIVLNRLRDFEGRLVRNYFALPNFNRMSL
jgi:hypothetical protein